MTKKSSIKLFATVYGVVLLFGIANSVFQFISDSIGFATGDITTTEYTVHDFVLKDFTPTAHETIVSTSPDPQIIIENYNKRATMLSISFEFSRYPGEVNLYYTYADEDFTDAQKVWGKTKNDGSYDFIMPRGNLSNIRIDPSSFENNEISINYCTLNPQRGFLTYFKYSGETIYNIVVYGALICCFISFIYTDFNKTVMSLKNKIISALNKYIKKA